MLLIDSVVVTWKSGSGEVVLATELVDETEEGPIAVGDTGEGLASLELELPLLV